MRDRFDFEEAHIERIYRHHDAIRQKQFDVNALIPGYDIHGLAADNLGIPRLPHMACLALNGSPVGPGNGLNFWTGKMSKLQLVQGFYSALRIEPSFGDDESLSAKAVGISSQDREAEILNHYSCMPIERAIRTLLGVGVCDLAHYIVLNYQSNPLLFERLKARCLMLSKKERTALPSWPKNSSECRSLVPTLDAFSLMAELTRFAQQIVAHGRQAVATDFKPMSHAKMLKELRKKSNGQSYALLCQTLAAAMGMETLLPEESARNPRDIAEAAREAVSAQYAAIVAATIDAVGMTELAKAAQQQIGSCPTDLKRAALAGNGPRTDAVRAFGLTLREHLAWGLARIHRDAWKLYKSSSANRKKPRYRGDIQGNMSAAEAVSCITAELLRAVHEDAASAYAAPARAARRNATDDPEPDNSELYRPVGRDEFAGRGETVIATGSKIKLSDPESDWPTAGIEYDHTRWTMPQTKEKGRFQQVIGGFLAADCGIGIASKADRRPDNIAELQRRGSGNHVKQRIRSVADDAEIAFLSEVARDVTLTVGASGLSRGHYMMRDLAAQLRELSAKAESDKPRNMAATLSAPCLAWNRTPSSIVTVRPSANLRSDEYLPSTSSLVQTANIAQSALIVGSLVSGGSNEPTCDSRSASGSTKTNSFISTSFSTENFGQAAIDLAHFEK
jgi:hypothetical protein